MADEQPPHITAIYRYPVKGMTPEALPEVTLTPGDPLPFDRAWAIENGGGRFDPNAPRYLPKINFVMLMRDERLASLEARFDETDRTLTIFRAGKQVARGALDTKLGRQMLEQFIAAYMKSELRGAPKIVSAPGHSFSDVSARCVHIVNLASVRDLERVIGRTVDPRRFRPNIVLDGIPPWEEFKWVGRKVTAGDATLDVFTRTQRCDATNVDPVTAARDMAIPAMLMRHFGHSDFGIYAKVVEGGRIATGSPLSVASPS
jgi:uncharacterized protein YcbX